MALSGPMHQFGNKSPIFCCLIKLAQLEIQDKIFTPPATILCLTTPVKAEIDPKVREACLPSADFLGCVTAMTGEGLFENKTFKKDTNVMKELLTLGMENARL